MACLFARHGTSGLTVLKHTAKTGLHQVVEALLVRGSIKSGGRDPDDRTFLHHAAASGILVTVRLLVKPGTGTLTKETVKVGRRYIAPWQARIGK